MDGRGIRTTLHGLVAIAAIGAGAPAPGAVAAERAELDLRLTERAPAAPTGLELGVVYRHPDDADAKPPQIRRLRIELPAGAAIDDGALPRCEASDEQLRLLGRHACPPASELGRGRLVADSGLGAPIDPLHGDVTLFNGRGELIELVTFHDTEVVAGFDRLRIDGGALVGNPPATPGGPPDWQTTIRSVRFAVAPAGTAERPYLRTPPRCPPGGAWTATGTFAFADGGEATASATTPCARAVAADARRVPRLHVRPRRVRAREPARFHVRVVAAAAGCAAGASVRLGRARARTGADGRATLVATLRRPGRARVRALKRGCGRATALVRVLAARG